MNRTEATSSLRTGHTLSWFEQTFLDYIRESRLMVPRCTKSGAWLPLTIRPETPSDVEWIEAEGRAVLYSFARYHRQYTADFPTPYQIALVELSEGLRLISAVSVDDAALLNIDMPLRATFTLPGRLSFVPQR
ncbi:putative nucleic-acid-binding protein containing a Zn-ribbon [Burkholderia sp. Ch1-1]|nr:putative nucleic-acid-binding protein containing a Zn-ribbon [Burkholderia sp. Ch1-1]